MESALKAPNPIIWVTAVQYTLYCYNLRITVKFLTTVTFWHKKSCVRPLTIPFHFVRPLTVPKPKKNSKRRGRIRALFIVSCDNIYHFLPQLSTFILFGYQIQVYSYRSNGYYLLSTRYYCIHKHT